MFNSLEDLAKAVLAILGPEPQVKKPIIIRFKEPTLFQDIDKEPIKEFFAAFEFWISSKTNKTEIVFYTKTGDEYFFYLRYLKFESISEILLHPEYEPIDKSSPPAVFQTQQEFDKEIMDVLADRTRQTIYLRFSQKVYLPTYDLLPNDEFKVQAQILELKNPKNGDQTFKPYACIYIKPRKTVFYFTKDIIPFGLCTEIIPSGIYTPSVLIVSSKQSGMKKLKLQPTSSKKNGSANAAETVPANQTSLMKIIEESKVKARFRDANRCVICGRPVNRDHSLFVRLLSNGNLVSSLSFEYKPIEIGFLPIGPDCNKKLPEGYSFTTEAIKNSLSEGLSTIAPNELDDTPISEVTVINQ